MIQLLISIENFRGNYLAVWVGGISHEVLWNVKKIEIMLRVILFWVVYSSFVV